MSPLGRRCSTPDGFRGPKDRPLLNPIGGHQSAGIGTPRPATSMETTGFEPETSCSKTEGLTCAASGIGDRARRRRTSIGVGPDRGADVGGRVQGLRGAGPSTDCPASTDDFAGAAVRRTHTSWHVVPPEVGQHHSQATTGISSPPARGGSSSSRVEAPRTSREARARSAPETRPPRLVPRSGIRRPARSPGGPPRGTGQA